MENETNQKSDKNTSNTNVSGTELEDDDASKIADDGLRQGALDAIKNITIDTRALRERVEHFDGPRSHPDYLRLEEELTRLLLKLDAVESYGIDEIRSERRKAVAAVQSAISLLGANGAYHSRALVAVEVDVTRIKTPSDLSKENERS